MTSADPEIGLRDRKLARTREQIERAALEAVDELGYDAASVEEICRRADISERTFFNHWGTKDNAILGGMPAEITPAAIADFMADPSDDIIGSVLTTITAADRNRTSASDLVETRRQVIVGNPHLFGILLSKVDEQARVMTDAVATKLADRWRLNPTDPIVVEHARMAVAQVGALFRASSQHWLSDRRDLTAPWFQSGRNLGASLLRGDVSFAQPPDVLGLSD